MALRGKINDVCSKSMTQNEVVQSVILYHLRIESKHVTIFKYISSIDDSDLKENFTIAIMIEFWRLLKQGVLFCDTR